MNLIVHDEKYAIHKLRWRFLKNPNDFIKGIFPPTMKYMVTKIVIAFVLNEEFQKEITINVLSINIS